MFLKTVCRVCLIMDVPMHIIADSPLQNIYEKLTNTPVNTAYGSVVVCYICHSQLKKCHNLMVRSVRAEKVLTRIIRNGEVAKEELSIILNHEAYRYALSTTPVEIITVASSTQSLIEDIKEEPLSPQCAGEIEIHTSICVEHLKSAPEDEYMERASQDIESEEPIDGQVHDQSERTEASLQSRKSGGGASSKQHAENIDDRNILTSGNKNLLSEPRTGSTAIAQELSKTRIGSNISAKIIANNTQVSNTSTCSDTALNKRNVSENCIGINIDLDNNTNKLLTFICNDCGNMFYNKHLLIEHVKDHGVKKKHNRIYNKKSRHQHTTLRKQKLILSVSKHTKTYIGNNLFECEICNRTFAEKRNLTRHLISHTGEKSFECEICSRKFLRNEYLIKHLKTHTREDLYECEMCELTFYEKGSLNRHLKTHSGEKPYQCNKCKISFNRKANLKRHMKTHTGEKPYECDVCKFKFSERDKLVIHLRTHTGEKPFQCKVCKVRFNQKGTLNRHLRTHTAEKPFECKICHQRFSRDLKRHLKTYTGSI